MKAPDTSVLVAGLDSAHTFHEPAQAALAEVRGSGRLIAHTLAETFAVLTAPGPYGLRAAPVVRYLDQFLQREPIGLTPSGYVGALRQLDAAGIVGGAVYDALIAMTARGAGVTLVTLDRRASHTYRRCGAEFELLLP